MGFLIDVGVAKTNKYASRESGDTVEVVERPGGGVSVVIADGQGSGRAAKSLSMLVAGRAAAMIRDGVRDGATARGVGDILFALRSGQVSATLDILSVDARTGTLLATRNASVPMLVGPAGALGVVPCDSGPLGVRHLGKPRVWSWPLEPGLWAVVGTDGILCGDASSAAFAPAMDSSDPDLGAFVSRLSATLDAQGVADAVLAAATARDKGKPRDDISVAALRIAAHDDEPRVRRLSVRVPLP